MRRISLAFSTRCVALRMRLRSHRFRTSPTQGDRHPVSGGRRPSGCDGCPLVRSPSSSIAPHQETSPHDAGWSGFSPPTSGRALDAALTLILAVHGIEVCGTAYGRHLGHGLFEFRLDEDEATVSKKWTTGSVGPDRSAGPRILLRVFCHATGDRFVLLLGGYDKGRDPSRRRQQREIVRARARLNEWLRHRGA